MYTRIGSVYVARFSLKKALGKSWTTEAEAILFCTVLTLLKKQWFSCKPLGENTKNGSNQDKQESADHVFHLP